MEDPGGSTIPRVCLGRMKSHMSNVESCVPNECAEQLDGPLEGQANVSGMLNGGRTGIVG